MSTYFYLVRHATKDKGVGDVVISPKGILQATATAFHFRGKPFNKIVCSPLTRALQTAKIIAEETALTIYEDIRLRERVNWGDLPGQTFEDFVEMWDRCTQDRDYSPPVGDSARKAGERLAACLLDLSVQHPEERILVVTHGGLISDFLVNVIDKEELGRKHPDFITQQSYLIAECSITEVSCHDGVFKLHDFATVDHL